MTPKKERLIPEKKVNEVKELIDLIKSKRTILIASIKNIPASQFQEIGKKLRGKAIIKVPKKNLIFRALDKSGNRTIEKLKSQIKDSVAILFSGLDSFDLAGELIKNKSPSKAKAGQEAPFDIEVEAGPTELVPGPAISELGAVGIQVQVEKGKLHIKEPKVIAKEGEKIKQAAADIMNKLDIKPFSIGFLPLAAFDTKEEKLYLEITIDREATLEELKTAYSKALGFAVGIGIINSETIKVMVSKAGAQEKKINRILSGEPEEVVEEALKEEVGSEQVQVSSSEDIKQKEGAGAAGLASLF